MRDFNCAWTLFNAGLLAIVDAIGLPAFPNTRFEARSEASGFDFAILQRFGGD
jgi:hypothetical protein